MVFKKITELTAIPTVEDADLFAAVDGSDTTTKKATALQIKTYIAASANFVETATNKDMTASVTVADNDQGTATAVAQDNDSGGYIGARVNGLHYETGDGTKVGVACYFSGDGGVTARAFSAVVAGDTWHWNGSIVGFQLDANDRIDFTYEEGP